MSRPRLGAERKVSTSLAFSPTLIAALDLVRGSKSQSVYTEECLRRDPAIATALAEMDDPGYAPSVSRYEALVDALLAFYWPNVQHAPTLRDVLAIAHKIIMRDGTSSDREIQQQMSAAMFDFWQRERSKHGMRNARGESTQSVLPAIQEYARLYYQSVFQEMAEGERALLQHHFMSLVHGCQAVYQGRRIHHAES